MTSGRNTVSPESTSFVPLLKFFFRRTVPPHHRLKEWCDPPLHSTLLSCSIFFPVSLELLNVMLRVCLLTIHFPYQTGNHLRLKTLFCTFPEPELHKCSGITDSQTLEKIEASQGVHIVTGGCSLSFRESPSTGRKVGERQRVFDDIFHIGNCLQESCYIKLYIQPFLVSRSVKGPVFI